MERAFRTLGNVRNTYFEGKKRKRVKSSEEKETWGGNEGKGTTWSGIPKGKKKKRVKVTECEVHVNKGKDKQGFANPEKTSMVKRRGKGGRWGVLD